MSRAPWQRISVAAAGLIGATAVGFAAYGAHGLDGQAAEWIEKGSRFALIHAVALLALGVGRGQGGGLKLAALFFVVGAVLFSGTLFLMAVTALRPVFLVPIGGTSFILGWLAVFSAALRPGSPDAI